MSLLTVLGTMSVSIGLLCLGMGARKLLHLRRRLRWRCAVARVARCWIELSEGTGRSPTPVFQPCYEIELIDQGHVYSRNIKGRAHATEAAAQQDLRAYIAGSLQNVRIDPSNPGGFEFESRDLLSLWAPPVLLTGLGLLLLTIGVWPLAARSAI